MAAAADDATAGAAAASHTKAEEMQEHSISWDAELKDKAYTVRNAKLAFKMNIVSVSMLELPSCFTTVIVDNVMVESPKKIWWPLRF